MPDGFLGRWSKRKLDAKDRKSLEAEPQQVVVAPVVVIPAPSGVTAAPAVVITAPNAIQTPAPDAIPPPSPR